MRKTLLVLAMVAVIGFVASAQSEPPADPGFTFLAFAGPFSVSIKTYEDYDGKTQVDTVDGAFKFGLILGPKIAGGEWGSVYAVATPYFYGGSFGYEYGTGLGAYYYGKPAFLGIELPVYASGMDATTESSYTISLGDFHKASLLVGTTATYQRRSLLGGTKTGRLFGAFKISYTDPGSGYYKYTGIGILFGGSL